MDGCDDADNRSDEGHHSGGQDDNDELQGGGWGAIITNIKKIKSTIAAQVGCETKRAKKQKVSDSSPGRQQVTFARFQKNSRPENESSAT